MAYKLRTEIGHAIYRLRKCTVEPVIGIIKTIRQPLSLLSDRLQGEAKKARLLGAAAVWLENQKHASKPIPAEIHGAA